MLFLNSNKKSFYLIKGFVFLFFAFLVIFFACSSYIYLKIKPSLPDPLFLKTYSAPEISRVYDRHYNLLHEYSAVKRVNISFNQIPKKLIAAFLVAEDKNFYYHKGIDPFRILKASVQNIFNIKNNKTLIGASTISQQVAKNFVVGGEKNILRKLKEAFVTFKMEYFLDKDSVLELYLNQIYMGSGVYGIQSASLKFFKKSVEELSIAEICLLASLPKAPAYLSDNKNVKRLKQRRDYIITTLKEQGYISDLEMNFAIAQPIEIKSNDLKNNLDINGYYFSHLKEAISNEISSTLLTQGAEIISCIDKKMQNAAHKALFDGLLSFENSKKRIFTKPISSLGKNFSEKELKNIHLKNCPENFLKAVVIKKNGLLQVCTEKNNFYPLTLDGWNIHSPINEGDVILVEIKNKKAFLRQLPTASGGIVVMEAKTGKVLALVGGINYNTTPFNCATQAFRQPGSSFKPFVYLAALENGIKTGDIINDEKLSIKLDNNKIYSPRNADRKFHGAVTVKTSFAHSYNLALLNLSLRVGIESIRDSAELFGIYENASIHPSIVLGAQETTLLKLTTAYGMILNGGYYITPKFYSSYIKRNKVGYGNELNCAVENNLHKFISHSVIKNQKKIASDNAIYGMLELLRSVVTTGTAKKMLPLESKYGITIFGKTGTSNNNNDAWFIGGINIPGTVYQGDNMLVIGVFVGFLKPESLGKGNGGSCVAMPIFSNFIENVFSDMF